MNRLYFVMALCLCLASCGASKRTTVLPDAGSAATPAPTPPAVTRVVIDKKTCVVDKQSSDATYGYSERNPIKVGGVMDGPRNERAFLDALAGPAGEKVEYERRGNCCGFETANSPFGYGLLDIYIVSYEGIEAPVKLYLNMYDSGGELKVPVGFTLRTAPAAAPVAPVAPVAPAVQDL